MRARRARIGDPKRDDRRGAWGIALSGGGIRSATFCAGLLNALAQNRVFHRFDLMSTVSGGGYIGATIGKLFQNAGECDKAPLDVEQALADMDARRFSGWLRANGRYLIPGGTRDILFAVANFIRALLTVHAHLAVLSLVLGSLLVGMDLAMWGWADCISSGASCRAPSWITTDTLAAVSPWPTIWILLPLLVWFGAALVFAYGAAPEEKSANFSARHGLVALACAATIYAMFHFGVFASDEQGRGMYFDRVRMPIVWFVGIVALLAACIVGIVLAWILRHTGSREPEHLRNRFTRWLALDLRIIFAVIALGIIDGLAWWLARGDLDGQSTAGASIAVTAVVLRALLPKLAELPQNLAPQTRARLLDLVNLAGLALLILLVVFWVSLVHRAAMTALFPGDGMIALDFASATQWLAIIGGPALAVVLLTSSDSNALNRSSLYAFYRARLVRSYLGAANPRRFDSRSNDATAAVPLHPSENAQPSAVDEVHPLDDVSIHAYAPHEAGGPVHLINVCLNQTRDPRGGLCNQDRKGLLMTIGPSGHCRVGRGPWQRMAAAGAPSLGSWMAISGAAVGPGLGMNTRPGLAALSMIAGLRLGYWWDGDSLPRGPGDTRKSRWQRVLSPKYGQFFAELFGHFDGQSSRYQYLSDGGHFENTGAYTLLQEQCELIVMADCGADARYSFRDLENLVRKARIDLQTEITFLRPKAELAHAIPRFGSIDDIASPEGSTCLALARVTYRDHGQTGHVIVVKPNISADMPVDLVNFKADNPLFPQESTTDQLFSEAQWESYFRLGQTLGLHLNAAVLDDIAGFATKYFEDDRDTTEPATGAHRPAPEMKRMPARIAAASAVTASFSVGAIGTLGFTTWQAVDAELKTRDSETHIQPAAFKELTEIFGKFAPSGQATIAPDDAHLGEMASAFLRIGEVECSKSNSQAFKTSPLILLMLEDTKKACRDATPKHPACDALIDDNKVATCLQSAPRERCEQQYWIRSYEEENDADVKRGIKAVNCPYHASWSPAGSAALASSGAPDSGANEQGETASSPEAAQAASPGHAAALAGGSESPAASAPPPAAPPVPVATAQTASDGGLPCAGQTIYIQIYGPELRDRVQALGDTWRALGASVPPVEDVLETARRNGRKAPRPYDRPTVIYHLDDAKTCANHLSPLDAPQSWALQQLSAKLPRRPRTIEVWIPPSPAVTTTLPSPAYCYQEDTGVSAADRYGVHCHATSEGCEISRGPNANRKQSACVVVSNLPADAGRYQRGFRGSWYMLASKPFGAPFPSLPDKE
ncbi:patatin-like phospholipase family protein [Paraburkholderia acidiphila]|uniref:PNPLA domain-containing protein n=1 Tax=Paraburkholderia acidiphila TaxID=2571747 RepID=A0A7Z2GBN6_9BURK|nr:patatin-like phospholipase family protein [Paraburkholderia acidiphila]QGZ58399.1 hypothetical protein FAZ97_25730 [Paraburkholderia acidiphila]